MTCPSKDRDSYGPLQRQVWDNAYICMYVRLCLFAMYVCMYVCMYTANVIYLQFQEYFMYVLYVPQQFLQDH